MSDAGAGEKLKVFISYSRRDSAAFADELVAGLEFGGFAPFLDRHDIAAGEDWEARLGGLIAQSDTVVFVISPEAVKSEQCKWEVDRATELSKRLLPVIFKLVPDHDIPEKLRRLQFVPFDGGAGFVRPLSQLAEALRVDLDWIRHHTRLGELARRWDARGRQELLLLRGDDVDEARDWVAARKPGPPEITDAQRAFIKASEEVETTRLGKERAQLEVIRKAQEATARQQRRIAWLLGGLAVLLCGSILGIIAWFYQSLIKEEVNWHWNVIPYQRANFEKFVLKPEQERALKARDEFRECFKDCPWMIVVPAGKFMMGSPVNEKGRDPNEGPQHSVIIASRFAVSKFDVTFADWIACASVGVCPREGGANDNSWGRGDRPVINVNWDDAGMSVPIPTGYRCPGETRGVPLEKTLLMPRPRVSSWRLPADTMSCKGGKQGSDGFDGPERSASMVAVQLLQSRKRPGSRSCDLDGTPWHKPAAPASRHGRAQSARGPHSVSPCRPRYRSDTAANLPAWPQSGHDQASHARRSSPRDPGQSNATCSYLYRCQWC